MKTTVDKLSDTRVKLTVNVPCAELDKEIDQAYAAIAQQVSIPGFRKGKAPRQLVDVLVLSLDSWNGNGELGEVRNRDR